MTKQQEEYREYLRSAGWREKRTRALEHAENACQVCNSSENLQVHHRTYVRVRNEKPRDLTVLCADCHGLFHGHTTVAKKRAAPTKRAQKSVKAQRRSVDRAVVASMVSQYIKEDQTFAAEDVAVLCDLRPTVIAGHLSTMRGTVRHVGKGKWRKVA